MFYNPGPSATMRFGLYVEGPAGYSDTLEKFVTLPAAAWFFLSVALNIPTQATTGAPLFQWWAGGPAADNIYGTVFRAAFSQSGADVTLEQPVVGMLDPLTGRVTDPTIYNTQQLLGPNNTTTIAPTYGTNDGINVVVNIPAHSRTIAGPSGPVTLNYGAGSGSVTVSTQWWCYVDDPNLAGVASPTYNFTMDPTDLLYPGRYEVANGITPAAGGGGGSTGGGGGRGGDYIEP
jgi:hypothetical protein